MLPATLAAALINFLNLSINGQIKVGNWIRINGVQNLTNCFVDFENRGTIYRIRIWLTSGKNGAYITKRWYITISNETPKYRLEIHNIDLHNVNNYSPVNLNQSILKESFMGIGGANNQKVIRQNFPCLNVIFATIDNRNFGWESKLLLDIIDHGICREKIKLSNKNKNVAKIKSIKQQNKKTSIPLQSKHSTQTSTIITQSKTAFQMTVVECIYAVLSHKPHGSNKKLLQRFKDHAIKPLVRHYCEITHLGETTNSKIDLYKKHFKWSERAVYEYSLLPYSATKVEIRKKLKMEHIIPIKKIVDELILLPPNLLHSDIQNIFDKTESITSNGEILNLGYEILIVSHEEANVLNSSKKNNCNLIDLATKQQISIKGAGLGSKGTIAERLNAAKIELDLHYNKNTF